nr:chromate transporter [uncultured Prevotella sp.]
MEKDYKTLFKTFFKIGLMALREGDAPIHIIKNYVVDKYKWIEKQEFLDMIARIKNYPGIMTINSSILIGYKIRKTRGSIIAAFGAILPSFLLILLIALFFHQFEHNHFINAMFCGIRPAAVALVAISTFKLAKSTHITWTNCWIPAGGALFIWLLGVNPMWIIIAAGTGGFIYGRFIQPTEDK